MSNTEKEQRQSQSDNAIKQNFRAKEAHKYLGVGLSTLWLYVKQNKIKAYRLSDRVTIFKREELEAFVNGGTV